MSLLIFIGIPLCLSVSIVVWAIRNGIGPMPTSPKQKQLLLACLPANVEGNVFDLGSGWGTLAISLAKRLPGCQITGYESSPVPYFFSKVLELLFRIPNLKFKRNDVFGVDLRNASLVVSYLHPAAMRKLKLKLEEELLPETIVITNTFAVPGWNALKVVSANDIYRSKIYVYRRSEAQQS